MGALLITYIMQKQRKPGAWKERTLSTKSESISCRTEIFKDKVRRDKSIQQDKRTKSRDQTVKPYSHTIKT